jgi:phage shock protein A
MNEQADNTQIAADLAAAEAEQTAASAAPVTEASTANAPLRGVRAQVVEMVNQVKSLSQQLEQERTEREALAAQLAEARGKHPISAQLEASPSAGANAVETVAITPGKDTAAMPVADQAAPAVAPAAAETAPLTFDSLLESMEEPHRDVIEKHIVGLRTALDKEREERKAAQKAVRTTQAEVEQLPTLRQQLEQAAQDALDARAQATFFETAGTNNVKRGSARLAFLAAKDGQFFNDDGSVQWDSLQARFPDLFEGTDRSAPTGATTGTPVQEKAVVTERPVVAPRTSASAGAGAGAPPRRPFSMTSAIRSAAGRQVK